MKFCSKCGKEVMDDAVFCPGCGCSMDDIVPNKQTQKEDQSSLVWGIVSMIAWLSPIVGLPCSIVGIVIGVKKTKKVGLYLSIIGLVLTIINAIIGAIVGYNNAL